MAQPFIRSYDSTRDWDACLHIYYVTSHIEDEYANTIGSYIFCRAYLSLSPDTCFVLDDGTGRAVGYIIGTPDTKNFSKRWVQEFVPMIDNKIVPRPDIEHQDPYEPLLIKHMRIELFSGHCSMIQGNEELLQKYPAHLHIDILPEFQSKGYGPSLMNVFFSKVKDLGAAGVHLGMLITNDGARRFYDRLGYSLCDQILDSGKSGEVGREGDGLCLVKRLLD